MFTDSPRCVAGFGTSRDSRTPHNATAVVIRPPSAERSPRHAATRRRGSSTPVRCRNPRLASDLWINRTQLRRFRGIARISAFARVPRSVDGFVDNLCCTWGETAENHIDVTTTPCGYVRCPSPYVVLKSRRNRTGNTKTPKLEDRVGVVVTKLLQGMVVSTLVRPHVCGSTGAAWLVAEFRKFLKGELHESVHCSDPRPYPRRRGRLPRPWSWLRRLPR